MDTKPPTRTLPKLVMKEWPMLLTVTLPNDHREITVHAKEQDVVLEGASSYRTKDGADAPAHLKMGESITLIPKSLSDFTRVVEETGILDQQRPQNEGPPSNEGEATKSDRRPT